MAGKGNEQPVIIIKRVKKGNHDAPHGGAWGPPAGVGNTRGPLPPPP